MFFFKKSNILGNILFLKPILGKIVAILVKLNGLWEKLFF